VWRRCIYHCPPSAYLAESHLLGIARPKAEILEMLAQSSKDELRVICLVGCHGVGKTALARALYDHIQASEDYESIAWVSKNT
jgi:ATP-dependent Lon protease